MVQDVSSVYMLQGVQMEFGRASRIVTPAVLAIGLSAGAAHAACPPLPNAITNGQIADATQLMQNLEALRTCINNIKSASRELGPFAPPAASGFTFIDAPVSVTPTVTDVPDVGLVYSVPITNGTSAYPGAYRTAPSLPSWTWTVRAKYSRTGGSWPEFGLWIKDNSGKMIGIVSEADRFLIKRLNSNTSYDANIYTAYFPDTSTWFRVAYNGTNISFYFSWDGRNWIYVWQEPKANFLNGNLVYVGIGGLTDLSDTALWRPGSTVGAVVTYWDIDDDPAATRAQ